MFINSIHVFVVHEDIFRLFYNNCGISALPFNGNCYIWPRICTKQLNLVLGMTYALLVSFEELSWPQQKDPSYWILQSHFHRSSFATSALAVDRCEVVVTVYIVVVTSCSLTHLCDNIICKAIWWVLLQAEVNLILMKVCRFWVTSHPYFILQGSTGCKTNNLWMQS